MRMLVTGANGFIGSNLVKRLLDEDNVVIGMDKDYNKERQLMEITDRKVYMNDYNNMSKYYTFIWENINYIREFSYKLEGIDVIFHLAASADIRKSYINPTMDLENNVNGTNEILEIMRTKDIKNLIFSSSSSIYGETSIVPTPETVGDIKPISLYGASKLANEAFINVYCHLYGLRAWMFRFANVVGRNMHRGVIYDFVKELKAHPNELTILGDGRQEKSFFDVDDCVEGLVSIPNKDNNNSSTVYNLGNYETIKIRNLADIVSNELGANPKITTGKSDRGWPGDTPYTILSIDKALKTGWKPKYNCEESIRRTVRWLINK